MLQPDFSTFVVHRQYILRKFTRNAYTLRLFRASLLMNHASSANKQRFNRFVVRTTSFRFLIFWIILGHKAVGMLGLYSCMPYGMCV